MYTYGDRGVNRGLPEGNTSAVLPFTLFEYLKPSPSVSLQTTQSVVGALLQKIN